MNNVKPRVSVIICTYNRCDYLQRCLVSINHQEYPHYEIIVVNGPSTDDTESILKAHKNIKIISQIKLNGLSYARNLGISIADGDIIAFIDDDAVADKNWLEILTSGYTNPSIGGVGGLVVFPDRTRVQFDNGVINKNGIPVPIRSADARIMVDEYPIFMGTNCSFRKSVLSEIGGFDPFFKYYHDEADLCVRIIKAGYLLSYSRDACVIHEMAEGHNRKDIYNLNRTEITKNTIFFTLKNFRGELRTYFWRPLDTINIMIKPYVMDTLHKRMPFSLSAPIIAQIFKGAYIGYFYGIWNNVSEFVKRSFHHP